MSTPTDEMLNLLVGEDDEKITPDDLADMAKDDLEIEAEKPESEAEVLAKEEEEAATDRPPPKQVPVQELVAERKRRQDLERQIAELRAQQAQPQQPQPQQQPQPEAKPEPEPDYLDDPKAWTEWKLKQNQAELESLREQLKQTTQVQQHSQAESALVTTLQRSEAAFIQEHPDYYQALNHAREKVFADTKAELELLNVQATDQQIIDHLMNQERQLAANLLQRGINPAQYAYQIAQRRYGYQVASLSPGNGQAAPVGQPIGQTDVRSALRGLPSGDTGLQPERSNGNLPDEFAAAFAERFGRR